MSSHLWLVPVVRVYWVGEECMSLSVSEDGDEQEAEDQARQEGRLQVQRGWGQAHTSLGRGGGVISNKINTEE